MTKNNDFIKGIKSGLPICLGYLSVAFAFGIFAGNSGLGIFETVLISMMNVTSAGQLAAVPIITGGGSILVLLLSQMVINLRYALMSVSLSQKLDKTITLLDRFIISFVNTDEVFAVASGEKKKVSKLFMYGLILTPYFGWSLGTHAGAIMGNVLPMGIVSALGILIYAMFVAIVVPEAKRDLKTALCVALAIILSCILNFCDVFEDIHDGLRIIIAACIASGVFAILAPVDKGEEENE